MIVTNYIHVKFIGWWFGDFSDLGMIYLVGVQW